MWSTVLRRSCVSLFCFGVLLQYGCTTTQKEEPAPVEPKPVETRPVEPTPPVVEAPKPTPAPVKTSSTYTVRQGDNLWNIAALPSIYGDPYQWPLIYKANADAIKDADLIYPGQHLSIDLKPSAAAVNAAVTHAKTRGPWKLGVVEASDKAYLSQ